MKQKMKKLLSFALVLALCFSVVTVSSFASAESPVAGVFEGETMTQSFSTAAEMQKWLSDTALGIVENTNLTGKRLVLLQDIEISLQTISMKGSEMASGLYIACDFDLGGHTVTITGSSNTLITSAIAMQSSSDVISDRVAITNGDIICNFTSNSSMLYGIMASTTSDTYVLDGVAFISANEQSLTNGICINGKYNGAVGFKNCVVDLNVSGSTFTNFPTGGYVYSADIESGSYKNLPNNDSKVSIKGTKLTTLPEGVSVGTTVITSDATTAMIVKDGNAYLYDTLQDAVDDAAKRADTEGKVNIQLLQQPESTEVKLPVNVQADNITISKLNDSDSINYENINMTDYSGNSVTVTEDGTLSTTIAVTGVTLDKTSLALTVGDSATLNATVEPDNATNRDVTWSTSDNQIATVENGVVKGVAPGTTTITATAGEKAATCTVTVAPAVVPVESISLDKTQLDLYVGDTATLTATVEPNNATDKDVTWSTSNETVATVESGTVTAVGEGKTTITVTTNNGKAASCTVTVTRKEYGITATPDELDFGSVYSEYWQPDARTVTITNTGNQTVTLNPLAASSYFEISELSQTGLAPDGTATFTVRPRADLPIGAYSETIHVTGSDGVSADIAVSFAVLERPASSGGVTPPTHDISVDSGSHGDVEIWPEEAQQGTTVTITATPDKGYEVAEVVVTAGNGKEITVTDKGNNKYTFMMPGSDVTIEVTFQPVSDSSTSGGDLTITVPAGWVNPYTDVAASDWFYNAVGYATANGLMAGVGNNAFDPSGSMNRAMVWTVIARLAGQTISGSTWAEDAQAWAVAQGVSDGTNPDGAVSREELVTMLYRYAGSPAMNVPELALIGNYPDSANVSAWAQNAFAWAISKGVIEGRDGKLAAGDSITRAEAATILARFHLLTK